VENHSAEKLNCLFGTPESGYEPICAEVLRSVLLHVIREPDSSTFQQVSAENGSRKFASWRKCTTQGETVGGSGKKCLRLLRMQEVRYTESSAPAAESDLYPSE
jgi:hypothetical protein